MSITVLGLCLLKQKNKPVQAVQGLRCCSRFVFLCPLRGQRGACGCELELWIWNSIPGNGAGPLLGEQGSALRTREGLLGLAQSLAKDLMWSCWITRRGGVLIREGEWEGRK